MGFDISFLWFNIVLYTKNITNMIYKIYKLLFDINIIIQIS